MMTRWRSTVTVLVIAVVAVGVLGSAVSIFLSPQSIEKAVMPSYGKPPQP